MANKMFRLGILVVVLVFGMAVVGCDKGGVLTVTDFPADLHNESISVFVSIAGENIRTGENDVDPENGEYTKVRISKGVANIPLWNRTEDGSWEGYSGSGTGSVDIEIILPPTEFNYNIEAVTFSKGNAKISFTDLEKIEAGPNPALELLKQQMGW